MAGNLSKIISFGGESYFFFIKSFGFSTSPGLFSTLGKNIISLLQLTGVLKKWKRKDMTMKTIPKTQEIEEPGMIGQRLFYNFDFLIFR